MTDSRVAFGRMLRNWRRCNGWTQYTVCNWAKEAEFDAISYGNLSVIEHAKDGWAPLPDDWDTIIRALQPVDG